MNNNHDKEFLILFLNKTDFILSKIVNNPETVFYKYIAKNEALIDALRKSWVEIGNILLLAKSKIDKAWPHSFKSFKEAGLTGIQLEFKRQVFLTYYAKYEDTKSNWALKQLLAIINGILGSLKSTLPFIEALEEFKKFIEPMINTRRRKSEQF